MKSRQVALRTALVVAGLAITLVAADASAADFFDQVTRVTGKMGVLKTILVWGAFIAGLGVAISGGWDMYSITQRGSEAKWSGVGIKMVAGGLLMAITLWSGIIMETISGSSGTGASGVSFSSLAFPVVV